MFWPRATLLRLNRICSSIRERIMAGLPELVRLELSETGSS